MKTIINNKFLEYNFLIFPIWILPAYFYLKNLIGSEELTFLIFLFLFGETHFASSFLFYFDKENKKYINRNKLLFIFTPILLIIIYVLLGLYNYKLAILIGAIASGIHVTRQSIGITRIFSQSRNVKIEFLIYFSSFLFLIIGFFRFYFYDYISFFSSYFNFSDLINIQEEFSIFEPYYVILVFILAFLGFIEPTNFKKKLVNLTGVILYAPYLFVDSIYDAIVIGVGAHWSQYLIINFKIYFHNVKFDFSKKIQLFFIIFYSLIMSGLAFSKNLDSNLFEIIVLIPLSGQFFHYYIDAFIWRFSIKEIRESIGSRLFA